ncbi:MAG: EamA family transporter [Acidobacteria bacterium]|nr:EamA family transporter [Acidobacteriota bacterium]MCB9396501.1 EamA family transporter [Acidobacteriota bacterium]
MIYLIAASCLWSLSFGLISELLKDSNPFAVSLLRLGLSALVFLPFLIRKAHFNWKLWPVGLIQFGIMYCLYISSYHYLGAAEIAVLTLTTPVFVVLLDGFFERRINGYHWLAALLAIAAAYWVKRGNPLDSAWQGILLVQAANFCFALGQTLYKRIQAQAKSMVEGDMAWLFLSACLAPLAFLIWRAELGTVTQFSGRQWLALLYLGTIPSGLAFFLWNKGVTQVALPTVGILNNLKVPLGVLAAGLIFHQPVHWLSLIPAFVLLSMALFLTEWTKK